MKFEVRQRFSKTNTENSFKKSFLVQGGRWLINGCREDERKSIRDTNKGVSIFWYMSSVPFLSTGPLPLGS
jgi:hypothetical protein